jgi:hypothetical protein
MEITPSCCDEIMERHYQTRKGLGVTKAANKEAFYGFKATDVVAVYEHKQGFGAGLFFRISDGRVIDVGGRWHDPNPIWYDATSH